MMSTRIAIIQNEKQPLSGLRSQLLNAGHEVIDTCCSSAFASLAGDQSIDLLIVHADSREDRDILQNIAACPSLRHTPTLLVADDHESAAACSTLSERIDDIIHLPINAQQLTAKIGSLSRLRSMIAESHRRRQALRDFDILSPMDLSASTDTEGMSVLIVGSVDDGPAEILKVLGGSMAISFANDATDAVLQLERSLPDVIMVGSAMPAVDLETMSDRVRSTLEWCDLPILIIAERTDLPRLTGTTTWGGLEVMSPSTHPAAMRLRLRSLVRRWRLRRQLRGTMADRSAVPVLDAKTKLYDHSFFHHYVDGSIIDHRSRCASLSIVTVTLEGLSRINETFGYPRGDMLLKDMALTIACNCRAEDLAARTSGRRFAICLGDTTLLEANIFRDRLAPMLKRTRDALLESHRSALQIKLGTSQLTTHDDASMMIRRASGQSMLPPPLSKAS